MLVNLCLFLGGIALFLYGMQLMGDGLQKAAGAKLQQILAALTGVLCMGVVVGAVVTALLQSSSATTVMTVGLVNAGLLTLKQAFGIVMGANIGTTITAQLIAFKLTDYVTVLIFVGFLVQTFAKKSRPKFIGQVLLGFGLLMLGMNLMGQAAMPLRDYPGFVSFIARFADQPLLGVAIGTMMTICVQSSAATIGILMAMAGQGLIPLEGAVPVLLGDNIGTCITAVLAAFHTNATAKRVALSHVLFNFFGCIIFVIFLGYFVDFVKYISPEGDISRQIANAHSAFNILNTCIFLPLAGPFIKLVEYILPEKGEIISRRPVYLDDNMLHTPGVALELATKEVVRMGDLAVKDVETALAALTNYDEAEVKYVLEHEPVVDNLEEDITVYLTKISATGLPDELSKRHTGLLHACSDIERIGDHGETLAKRARSIFEDNVVFSPEAKAELQKLGELTIKAARMSLKALETDDQDLARDAWEQCKKVKLYQKEMRKMHIVRLSNGTCSPQAGFVLMELIINMKRISDHSKNVSQLVLGIF
jgi:phosphate:Na+ symporter